MFRVEGKYLRKEYKNIRYGGSKKTGIRRKIRKFKCKICNKFMICPQL